MKPIGGYPALSVEPGSHFHVEAMRLNLGRSCLEHILRVRKYRRVYLPHYTCSVVIEPFKRLDVEIHYYDVDYKLEAERLPKLDESEGFLYINYFGLKDKYVRFLHEIYGNRLIVDNSQAFYAEPLRGVDTFYSARKFFGVTDGAYLYCDKNVECDYPYDISYERMRYLLKRIDLGAEEGYADFQNTEESLSDLPIMRMSKLTSTILESIDYDRARAIRKRNFMILHEALKNTNMLDLEVSDDCVPLAYPYLQSDLRLRDKLIEEKIFVPKLWPDFGDEYVQAPSETAFRNQLLPLPVMQVYEDNDMRYIIETIRRY